MKPYKLKLTRPEALLALISSEGTDDLNPDSMRRCLYETTPLCYCVYTVLMEADIDPKDIISMDNDGEAIAITFKNKSLPKKIKDKCNREEVRYGTKIYKVKLKIKDRFLIAECNYMEDYDPE